MAYTVVPAADSNPWTFGWSGAVLLFALLAATVLDRLEGLVDAGTMVEQVASR